MPDSDGGSSATTATTTTTGGWNNSPFSSFSSPSVSVTGRDSPFTYGSSHYRSGSNKHNAYSYTPATSVSALTPHRLNPKTPPNKSAMRHRQRYAQRDSVKLEPATQQSHSRSPSMPSPVSFEQALGVSPSPAVHNSSAAAGSPLLLSSLRRKLSNPPSRLPRRNAGGTPTAKSGAELAVIKKAEHVAEPVVEHSEAVGWDEAPQYDELAEESRDALLDRLCGLVEHLSTVPCSPGRGIREGTPDSDTISALHAQVDEMERVLSVQSTPAQSPSVRHSPTKAAVTRRSTVSTVPTLPMLSDPFDLLNELERNRPPTSTSMMAMMMEGIGSGAAGPSPWLGYAAKFSELSQAAASEALGAIEQTARERDAVVEQVAAEAEKLNEEMERVMKSLQERKEESDHLQAILVERAEIAAARILDLEKEVADLEDDVAAHESEMRHLRLQLRAVETLAQDRTLPGADGADAELVQSIENWKADWRTLRDKMLAKKRERRARHQQRREEHQIMMENSYHSMTLGLTGTMTPGSCGNGTPALGKDRRRPREEDEDENESFMSGAGGSTITGLGDSFSSSGFVMVDRVNSPKTPGRSVRWSLSGLE